MFQETYRHMTDRVFPAPALVDAALKKAGTARRRTAAPLRRAAAVAAVAALCLSTTALAARTELGYDLLYAVAPAVAQSFQPVAMSCTDNGVTMEVVSVRVEGNTAQAYIALTGETVDETTDLFDSYSFRLPFSQSSHCEMAGYDAASRTATFLCTTGSSDGQSIPIGGKMTFSLERFLSGKEEAEGVTVDLDLSSYAAGAKTAPEGRLHRTGGAYLDEAMSEYIYDAPVLQWNEPLAAPVNAMPITAAGYADGRFHVQVSRGNALTMDDHCYLWLEDAEGNRLESLYSVNFSVDANTDARADYTEFVFDLSPDVLADYTLHGDFYTASTLTEGSWRVTFPLTNTNT